MMSDTFTLTLSVKSFFQMWEFDKRDRKWPLNPRKATADLSSFKKLILKGSGVDI